MRFIRYVFLIALAICLVVVAMANRGLVTLTLLPEELATFTGISESVEVPLYVVGFGGLVLGLLVGFFWEWLREGKHRQVASRQRRETARMRRELDRLTAEKHKSEGRDEVLALLETSGRAR
jgi:putative membrane protein